MKKTPCAKCRAEADGSTTRRVIVKRDQGFELKACDCAGKDIIHRRKS